MRLQIPPHRGETTTLYSGWPEINRIQDRRHQPNADQRVTTRADVTATSMHEYPGNSTDAPLHTLDAREGSLAILLPQASPGFVRIVKERVVEATNSQFPNFRNPTKWDWLRPRCLSHLVS